MAGTDISTGNADTNATHDHTYYGNGCPAKEGGNSESCTTRIVKDGDSEDQKNGTYFTFQAATTGTGGSMPTINSNSPDTFCPLGWQLPYSGTGGDYYDQSRSWNYLFGIYGITTGENVPPSEAIKARIFPFSYIFSGYFTGDGGKLYGQGGVGTLWTSTINNYQTGFGIQIISDRLWPLFNGGKQVDRALRCI